MDKEPNKNLRVVHVNKDIETPKTLEQLVAEMDLLTAELRDETTPAKRRQELIDAMSVLNKKIFEMKGIIKNDNSPKKLK